MPRSTSTARSVPVDRFFEISLLGMVASGFCAVAGSGFLDTPSLALTALVLAARALIVSGVISFQLSPSAVNALTLLYVAFYAVDYSLLSQSFLPATVHLILFLAGIRILSAHTPRDYFFVKVVAFLELLAACVLSASSNFFLWLALFFFFGVATFASSEIRRAASSEGIETALATRRFGLRLVGVSTTVSCAILLMAAGLFFLLPRTARAAFQHLMAARLSVPGFSTEIDLTRTGELRPQTTPVMHVRMDEGQNPGALFKWRGAVLGQFDGRRWFNAGAHGELLRPDGGGLYRLAGSDTEQRPAGRRFSYEVRLNDPASGFLFVAGSPEFLRMESPSLMRWAGGVYRLPLWPVSPVSYQVYSNEQAALRAGDSPCPACDYLRLPVLDPRIPRLARQITGNGTPEEQSRSVERYLRTHYSYTLELPRREAADPLAAFLFERKRGHCEYFASAMAVLLRTAGIPSRIATGFQSGLYNPVSGWQVIRASDAHSWVEAFIPGQGWLTFDPTPPDLSAPANGLLNRWLFYADAVDTFWQEWILNYNRDRQLLLAARVEQSGWQMRGGAWDLSWLSPASWRILPPGKPGSKTVALFAAMLLSIVLWTRRGAISASLHARRRRVRLARGEAHPGDATALYFQMLAFLERRGIHKPEWLTASEFAAAVRDPALAEPLDAFTRAYHDLRFGKRASAAAEMAALLRRVQSASLQ